MKVRAKRQPFITGALGTIKKGLDQNLKLFMGHLLAIGLHKMTLMSTAHSIGKCWDTSLLSVVEILTYQKTATL